jgi:hypothetical protein
MTPKMRYLPQSSFPLSLLGKASTLRSGGRGAPLFSSHVPAWRGDVVREKGACFQKVNTSSGSHQSINRLIAHYTLIFYLFIFHSDAIHLARVRS